MNEAILLSDEFQRKLNNDYDCPMKENSFMLPMLSLQLHSNLDNTC